MPYKSNKEINEEFDEKAKTYDKDGGFIVYVEGYDNTDFDVDLIKSHISQIRQNDLKGLVEWAESKLEDWASNEHERWAKWQQYVFNKSEMKEVDGKMMMCLPNEFYQRWAIQIDTPYSELSEQEKESDRKEVKPYITDIITHLSSLNQVNE